jgi:hypothetical protein
MPLNHVGRLGDGLALPESSKRRVVLADTDTLSARALKNGEWHVKKTSVTKARSSLDRRISEVES